MHQHQSSQGASSLSAFQIGSSQQPIHAPTFGSAPSASLQQHVPHTQQLQLQNTQQTIQQQQPLAGKQNKITPVAKPAGLDPVVILQVCQSFKEVYD